MDFIYYSTFALLLFQCGMSAVISVVIPFQVIWILYKGIQDKMPILFVFLLLPLNLLNVIVSLYLLWLLRAEVLNPWYILVLTVVYSAGEIFVSRYFRKRMIVNRQE
ncbi:MAG: hypothetical protein ABI878_15710 [Acidobacteriota bacterium]